MRVAITIVLGLALISSCSRAAEVVTVDNYVHAETVYQLKKTIKNAGGINKWYHYRKVTELNNQPVIRMNKATVYSFAVVDAEGGLSVVIPETNGRYVSVQVVDENHHNTDMVFGPGTHKLDIRTKYAWLLARVLVKKGSPEEMRIVHKIQDGIEIKAASNDTYTGKDYDTKSRLAITKKLNALLVKEPFRTDLAFGKPDEVVEKWYRIGAAAGWGGASAEYNIYQSSPAYTSFQCQSVTFEDPKNKGFTDITVYNKDGYLFSENANITNFGWKPNSDGSITVRFGCDGQENNLDIKNDTGEWNFIVRNYTPSEWVRSGDWDITRDVK
jgi:hypothetical protein